MRTIRWGVLVWLLLLLPGLGEGPARPPQMTTLPRDPKAFEYVEANVPFYPPGGQWGKTADPIRKMQKPVGAAESIKHFVHPVGFELRLFVSEEQLGGGKPMCMNWDERGRLWLALTVDYPNERQPEGQGRDRIVICEDTDGDGLADKITTFADKLSIPTSFTFARGGIIVQQAPHTLFLRDTDGDDKADERTVLFSGWGTMDTHAGPSNLQCGFDNWIYGICGYSGFDGTLGGERHKFGQGFYRFTPDGSKLEFLRSTNNNSWGVGFSEEGLLFGSTANGNPSMHLPIPNRYYERVRGWSSSVLGSIADNARYYPITDKVRQVDHHGNFTSAAGHALYTARSYPREYWNRTAFVADPTGHLVATFQIEPSGGSFRSRNAWNLVASDDEWCAPIAAEVGPDGNVWIIDWYNYIVQHNPTPPGFKTGKGNAYESPLRDKKHGRVYRLVPKDAKPKGPFSLKDASPEKLVETLKNDNLFWRRHAQRLLVERGKRDVEPALQKLAADPNVDEIGLNVGAIHALWTLHGLDVAVMPDSALKHRSAGVRMAAVQKLPRSKDEVPPILAAKLHVDPDLHVRLATLLVLAEMPALSHARDLLIESLRDEATLQDRWLKDAAIIAASAHADLFLPELGRRWDKPVPAGLTELLERMANHLARGAPEDVSLTALLESLEKARPEIAEPVIVGLARGWPKEKRLTLNEETEKILVGLLPKLSPAGRGQLVTLAARWGSKVLDKHAGEIAAGFLTQVKNEKESDKARIEAATQLVDFKKSDAATAKEVLALLTPRTAPELAHGLLAAVARSEAPATGTTLVELLPTLTPGVRSTALRALLGRGDWTGLLLDAIDQGKVQLAELSLEQRQTLAAHPSKEIAARAKKLLARGGGLPSADRQKVIDELLPLVKKQGDAAAGKLVFKNQCAKCHTHGGEGEKIGPDLTGMAVHPREHLLVEIMDPSRSVEGNYRQYVVSTKSGRILTGLLASESKTAVELIDPEAKKQTIQRDDIEELIASPKSFMPEGFEKQLKPDELVNLLEFLTQRGKFLPVPLDKVATVVSTKGMFNSEDAQAERLIFADWSAKTFQGVPFQLVDPRGERVPNVVLLYGPQGKIPPRMPKSVSLPCNAPAKAIHFLGGVSGWGHPGGEKGSVTMIVRLRYADGKSEDHALKNGVHFADYIRRVDVPESQFAFALRGQQVRYLAIQPQRREVIKQIELVKGADASAPVVMAVTVETGSE